MHIPRVYRLVDCSGGNLVSTKDLYSTNGTLYVNMTYFNLEIKSDTLEVFCYMTDDGLYESPTLRLNPGDTLHFTLTNGAVGQNEFYSVNYVVTPLN